MGNREEAQTGDGGINKHSLINSRFFKCQEHCSQAHNTFTHNSVCVFLAIVHPVTSDTGITILPTFRFTKWEFRTLPEKTVHSWFLDRNSSMCSHVLAILTKLFWLFTTNMLRNWNFKICSSDGMFWLRTAHRNSMLFSVVLPPTLLVYCVLDRTSELWIHCLTPQSWPYSHIIW